MSKFVVVAGAGISVDYPSNLPSWWKFNESLINVIKKRAENLCPKINDLFSSITLDGSFPVQTLSDVLVRNGMGKFYFPILKMLNSDRPNANHFALVELVKNKLVDTIVTTNFDKLIELAFEEKGIPIKVMFKDLHFKEHSVHENVVLKIHGSVDDATSFIDTVTQKAVGLSKAKKNFLKERLDCDIVFIGFSGADFDFDDNYIPINTALENNKHIKWIIHPGSKISENILRLKALYPAQVEIEEKKLSSFFSENGVVYHKIDYKEKKETNFDFEKQIESFFDKIGVDSHACLGYCLHFLFKLGKNSECKYLMEEYEKIVNKLTAFPFDAVTGVKALACMEMSFAQYEKAIKSFLLVVKLSQKMREMRKKIKCLPMQIIKELNTEIRLIYVREYLNIAIAYYFLNDMIMAKCYIYLARKYLLDSFLNEKERLDLLEQRIDCGDEKAVYEKLENIIPNFQEIGEVEHIAEILISATDSFLKKGDLGKVEKNISVLKRIMKNVFSDEFKTYFCIIQWNYYAQKGDSFNSSLYLKQSITNVLKNKSKKLGRMILQRIKRYHAPSVDLIPEMKELCKMLGDDVTFFVSARNGDFLVESDGSVVQKTRRIATHDFGL